MVPDHPPETGHHRVHVGVGPHPRGVEEQLLAPHQAGLLAELHHVLEEAPEDAHPQALPDLAQGGVVGQGLVQGVPQVPAVGQVQAGRLDELALAAQPLEEHHQLELEIDHRVEARSPNPGVAVADQLAHEGEVERRLQVAVEVARRHQVLQRGRHRPVDVACLRRPEHRQSPPAPDRSTSGAARPQPPQRGLRPQAGAICCVRGGRPWARGLGAAGTQGGRGDAGAARLTAGAGAPTLWPGEGQRGRGERGNGGGAGAGCAAGIAERAR